MPPGLSGSPPSFSRRAYYNRPSCNHQPSLSLSASLRAFDIHIAADTNSLTHYSPPPLLNKANKCTLWLFFFLFTRCRRCCSVLREGRKEGSGGQVFPANGLKTEPRGNRGFWLLVGTAVVAILDIGCFLPGREWMGLDLGRFVLGMMRCVCVCMCVYICYLILEKKKEGFSSFQVYNKIEHKIYRILISS